MHLYASPAPTPIASRSGRHPRTWCTGDGPSRWRSWSGVEAGRAAGTATIVGAGLRLGCDTLPWTGEHHDDHQARHCCCRPSGKGSGHRSAAGDVSPRRRTGDAVRRREPLRGLLTAVRVLYQEQRLRAARTAFRSAQVSTLREHLMQLGAWHGIVRAAHRLAPALHLPAPQRLADHCQKPRRSARMALSDWAGTLPKAIARRHVGNPRPTTDPRTAPTPAQRRSRSAAPRAGAARRTAGPFGIAPAQKE